jgi:hypothetical protein
MGMSGRRVAMPSRQRDAGYWMFTTAATLGVPWASRANNM